MKQINRVFFFANYTPVDISIGITKKIRSEINTLRKMGMDVTYTAYDGNGVSIFDNHDTVVFRKPYPTHWEKLNRIARYYWLETVALDYVKREKTFDLGYIRMGPPNRLLFLIFKQLKDNGAKIVAESLAYFPGIKYKSLGGKYISLMYKVNANKFKDYLSYFLVEGNMTEMHDVKAFAMNIGVEVDNINIHQYKGNPKELNLISVANENLYHAYDRVIESLHYYLNKFPDKQIFVHLVGTTSAQTKELIKKYALEEKVILYGKKSGPELDEIYNKCNVGLGPLGQHRVGGKKDTGLKTKEYFAKGLPYIYSGDEPTVPEDYPYIYQFPSDESMIDFEKVRAFYDSYRNDEKVVENMRAFAKAHYSWDTIMKDALSHLE